MLASGLLIRWITCLIIKDVLCLKVMLPGLDKDYRRAKAELYRLAGVNFPTPQWNLSGIRSGSKK
ncbi:hypothetical protein HMPREF1621_05186 [Escherichia coli A25922R]|jgi:hypothetical protein|nr:hypothetical protein A9Z04_11060 [Escherichia coli]EEJ49732.1 hypothetical protein HMPREF0358_0278 [Escherichia coli 83972]EFJ94806.1 hypothetical protein HMPREF9531_00022 [Escherichia coli MS 45-1]EFU54753.1 hypothetical protein HMPREF9544_00113 [Escherichia coli MS 153-1]EGI25081.1 2-dehydro-3-deoxygluconokinase [Escherichia coli TA206]ESD37729.1 hypothetical protein HMPREF1603_02613 [Escherichia coli 907892]ESE26409.1 hypothetical protein HMPREF1621_05186 [Escherichia coli A25922R]KEJ0